MAQDLKEHGHVKSKIAEKDTSDAGSDASSDASAAATADPGSDTDVSSLAHKQARILDACRRKDIDDLQVLAISPGGFLSDAIRSQAWPILLGCRVDEDGEQKDEKREKPDSWRDLPRHRDEDQVKLDVDRSFVYYPTEPTPAQLEEKRAELSDLITEVLRRQPYLCYFQGYHDICQVLLLVLPAPLRASATARLSALRIRDFMLPSLAPAVAQLRLIPELLSAADPALGAHLARVEPYYFALADTLTMFAHNVRALGAIARLFDALLAAPQPFALYVFAQIVLRRRAELLALDDPDLLHFTVSKLPPDLDLDAVLADAERLFRNHPPESLPGWRRRVASASALRSARDVSACATQSLDDGKRLFDEQLREMLWAERRDRVRAAAWTHRRLILAVAVAAAAIYFRKAPFWASLVSWSTPGRDR
ncbi:rab-GTPase-TBC domain-containing protein [Hypoxylon sp. FL1284]|nr:rab-GTPase-TBC domain-containing protein [Hypoxylon sp. FL1284]